MLLKILTSGVFLYVKYSQDFANFSLNILYFKKKKGYRSIDINQLHKLDRI